MTNHWYCERRDERAIRISGADNLSFLQTKLTADTRRWRMTGGGYATATDINGKVLFDGTFALDGADVIAVVPTDLVDGALAHIDQYVIMEDVECELLTAPVVQLSPGSEPALGLEPDREEPSRAAPIRVGDAGALGFLAEGPTTDARRLVAVGDVVGALEGQGLTSRTLESLLDDEVRNGIPRIGRDFFGDKTIPLEAGLWHGVSLSKGCYLGQEVLERLFSRGRAARRLVRFESEGPPPPSDALVFSGEDEAGYVTSAVTNGAGTIGMAYIKRKFADAPLELDGGRSLTHIDYVGGAWPENP